MTASTFDQVTPDAVQVFDAGAAIQGDNPSLLAEMAHSPNCTINVLRVAAGGQLQVTAEPNADVIVLVLEGACTAEGPSGQYPLVVDKGVLVPAALTSTFTSTSADELALLTFSSTSPESRPGFIPNVPSGVIVRVPAAEITAQGIGRRLYVFAVDHRTIRIAVNATQEWNEGAFIRMNCQYEQSGVELLVNLPERMVRWYGLRELTVADYRIIPQPDRNNVLVDLGPLIEREAGV